jgi:hypothetical protein
MLHQTSTASVAPLDEGDRRARLDQLERAELRVLASAVGDHLPVELVLQVEAIRRERRALAVDLAA